MKRAVAWIRVSSVMQKDGFSPEFQDDKLVELAAKNSLEIVHRFNIVESAYRPKKKKPFEELIKIFEEGEALHLLLYSTSRISRNIKEYGSRIISLIDDNKLTLWVHNKGKCFRYPLSADDHFDLQLSFILDERESRIIGERTKDGLLKKAKKGGMPTHAPEGYKNAPNPDGQGKPVVVLENEAKVALVRQAFELYSEGGWSLSTLTEEINRRGFKTKPTSRRGNAGLTQHGLQKMLKNPFYYGMINWSEQLFPGKHEPIITKELFDRVQVKLVENCYCAQSHSKHLFFAFKKFLKCGHCGGRMEAYIGGNGKAYYQCIKHGSCSQGCYPESEIDELFADALGEFYLDDSLAEKIRERLKETHADSQAFEKKELKRLQTRYTQRKNHLDLIYEDRLNGIISVDQYKVKQCEIQNELKDIDGQIEKLGKYNIKYKEEGSRILELLNGFRKIYVGQDLRGKAQILGVILERCEIMGTKSTNHTGSTLDKRGTTFIWKPPFDTLFRMGQLAKEYNQVRKNELRGE